ncbi:restriction endonuclease [Azospirillum brasilense]|uniref:restriction endonuclease n=1 Tax=Azospirillum brasilense TaxID=192 RepID=UPI0013B40A57|nr:restriction endonuclease [Azospirillum brasilense]
MADLPDHRNDDVLDASGAATKIQLVLRKALRAIASEIARTPRALGAVEWRDLERVLREVFESIGFDTRLTRPGRDGGFDLEVSCFEEGRKEVYLVEVKHWKPPSRPGMAIVSRFTEVVIAERADRGLLLSSSGFTREVIRGRSEVEQQLVRIGSDSKIVTLCQLYVRNGRGAWLSTSALPEILFHGTI